LSYRESNQEQKLRKALVSFYEKHDPSKIDNIHKLLRFAKYHGIEALNEKIESKYGVGVMQPKDRSSYRSKPSIIDDDSLNSEEELEMALDAMDKQSHRLKLHDIDREQLRYDLIAFYKSENDSAQIEVVDNMIEWAARIGMDEFNEKLEQIYGISLEDKMKDLQRQNKVAQRRTYKDSVYSHTSEKKFENMTEEEITQELSLFFQKHDPSALHMIGERVKIAKRIGRADLNEKLESLYGETLDDVIHQQSRAVDTLSALESEIESETAESEATEEELVVTEDIPAGTGRKGSSKRVISVPPPPPSMTSGKNRKGTSPILPPLPPGVVAFNRNSNLKEVTSERTPPGLKNDVSSKKKTIPDKPHAVRGVSNPEVGPCNDYRLDMTGRTFGVCYCGFTRHDHKRTPTYEYSTRNSRGTPNVGKIRAMLARQNSGSVPIPKG